jgi:hypothetical protein
MQKAMEDASEFEWTSEDARKAYQSIHDAVTDRGHEIFGNKIVNRLSGDYHKLQARFLEETTGERNRAAEIAKKFATKKSA